MRIAVVGATGALGKEIVTALAEEATAAEWGRLEAPVLLASKASAGEVFPWVEDEELEVEVFGAEAVRGVDLAVLAVPDAVALELTGALRAQGIGVVDASTATQAAPWLAGRLPAGASAVSLPSAEALMLARALTALAPLKPRWVRATVLKAASGAGEAGVSELAESSAKLLNGVEPDAPKLPHRLAFNVLPQAGAFTGSDDAAERTLAEQLPVLVDAGLKVATSVGYGPWFYGHLADVTVGLDAPAQVEAAQALFRQAPAVKLLDDPSQAVYPMPSLATGDDAALVGRVRADPIDPRALRFLVVSDNVRSTATHAVAALKALALLRGAH